MNYKYTIFILSYVIILRKYLLVPGLGDIKVKSIKHVFMKFVCSPLSVGYMFHCSLIMMG